ncbi:MAG TPA: PSD1 and planctomycete cytochrome C domain-containing protein [Bryobacteraceae bacterium]|nr:PSD1 and planctomycete cytochrome C domain-containing protein [Bryobacteraceae bacterium]
MHLRSFAAFLLAGTAFAAEPVRFNRDIRPIMSDTCFRCHGPDARARQANLRLDQREEALKQSKTGVTPIVPGDPDKSAIVRRVFATNATVMPPRAIHKELTAAQKEIIRQWVKEGATYEGHWAWQPVQRPRVPQIADATSPIDAFIRARLTKEGLTSSPEADRRTLLRRVTLDLTGVPPTPEEFAAFVADKSSDAYERAVDRLLQKPGYAETQARYWLDAVRYADSAGFHGDNLWPAWPYRDYVLRAFRDNMPFDRFTREQLAGDLMPNATVDQKIASAYNRMNRVSAEGGLQPKEYLAKYGADRVRTLSTVWMGATLGCAECHDHKFDPFTSKDFYSMKAFFADIKESGLVSDRGGSAWGSKLALPTEAQTRALQELDQQLEVTRAGLKRLTDELATDLPKWEERIRADHAAGKLAWKFQRPLSASSTGGAVLKIFNDEPVDFNYYLNGSLASERKLGGGLIIASGPNPDDPTYTVKFKPGAGVWTALGIEIQQDETLPGNRLSRGADRFVITEVEADRGDAKLNFVLATSTQSGEWPENPAMAAIDGDGHTGWGVGFGEHRNAFLALRFATPVTTAADAVITLRIRHGSEFRRATIGRFRIALSSGVHSLPETGESGRKKRMAKPDEATVNVATDRGLTPELQKILETKDAERTEQQRKALLAHYQWSSPELQDLVARVAQLETRRALIDAAIPRVLYTETVTPAVTRILPRANWMDETHEIVEPAVPAFLGKLAVSGKRATRLDLADWIVSRDNPLTARVFVNRLWRQFFGTGLSKVLEDLGSQGEWPTHPELLDWLAAEFMERWDVKHVIRTIVTSQTYRQSSASNAALDERDPENRLLARQSRFRVDAEAVHDVALSVSGLLVERLGGPSVKPYGPDGYLAGMNFPKREYSASRGDDLHRRALYTQWQRTFLHPSLLTMDAPTREECAVNRVNSNTPLQALELLNDPIFVEAARVFAQNILKSGGATFDARLNWAFTRALNRAPDPDERKILSGLYQKSLAHFRATPAAANQFATVGEAPTPATLNRADVAATAMVARAILNLHETITRN